MPQSQPQSQLSQGHRQQLQALLAASPLIPVITIEDPAKAVALGRALVDGGINILEITLRTEHGLEAIRALRQALPETWVGAGTVKTVAQYRQVEAAGAQFVITPGVTPELLEHGIKASAPLLPGVATLSELMLGYALGYREFKFFPAEVSGGVDALKAFGGPFADVRFCPTGGIRQETAARYLALANVAAVGGTWLTPREAIEADDWARISQLVADSLALCRY